MAGVASVLLYLYLRDPGREISWKDFVHRYLDRGLVRTRLWFTGKSSGIWMENIASIIISVACLLLDDENFSKVFRGHSTQWSAIVSFLALKQSFFLLFQVDRLEVVNKQFVRVILVPGADSSEGVSYNHSLCRSSYLCGMALIYCCVPSELRVV